MKKRRSVLELRRRIWNGFSSYMRRMAGKMLVYIISFGYLDNQPIFTPLDPLYSREERVPT